MTFVFSLFLEKEKRECQAIVDGLRDTLDVRNATIESLQKVLGETEMLCSSLKVPLPSHPIPAGRWLQPLHKHCSFWPGSPQAVITQTRGSVPVGVWGWRSHQPSLGSVG